MPARKQPPATVGGPASLSTNVPMPERTTSKEYERIPNGAWVTGRLVDAENVTSQSGRPMVAYQFEVTNPRLYKGITLYHTLHDGLDKSLDEENPQSLAANFPGVDLLNADSAWDALAGVPLRIHVGHRTVTDVQSGEVRFGYRVSSFRVNERARVS